MDLRLGTPDFRTDIRSLLAADEVVQVSVHFVTRPGHHNLLHPLHRRVPRSQKPVLPPNSPIQDIHVACCILCIYDLCFLLSRTPRCQNYRPWNLEIPDRHLRLCPGAVFHNSSVRDPDRPEGLVQRRIAKAQAPGAQAAYHLLLLLLVHLLSNLEVGIQKRDSGALFGV